MLNSVKEYVSVAYHVSVDIVVINQILILIVAVVSESDLLR